MSGLRSPVSQLLGVPWIHPQFIRIRCIFPRAAHEGGWALRRHSSRHTRRTTGRSRKRLALPKMLQRLGLAKASVNGANGTEGANGEAKREVVSVPPVEEFEQARFLKVVCRERVAVRASPSQPAPENGQVSLAYVHLFRPAGILGCIFYVIYPRVGSR